MVRGAVGLTQNPILYIISSFVNGTTSAVNYAAAVVLGKYNIYLSYNFYTFPMLCLCSLTPGLFLKLIMCIVFCSGYELVRKQYRNIIYMVLNVCYDFGGLIFYFLAYFIRDWRSFCLTIFILGTPYISYIWSVVTLTIFRSSFTLYQLNF